MEPTTLVGFLETGAVQVANDGLRFIPRTSWVVDGEDRLSYATIVRLFECCREVHWQRDILPNLEDASPVDTTCTSLSARFLRPIIVGRSFTIRYAVTAISEKRYVLTLTILDIGDNEICAEGVLELAFYDPSARKAVIPPRAISESLQKMLASRL